MAGSMGNSVALMKASLNVLKLDKELLVFPLMSGIASILVIASFVAPMVMTGAWEVFEAGGASYGAMALAFGFYVVMYTVTFFFNSALVGAALIRLDGGDPTVSDGLSIASKRMGSIIGYAVVAATVGMILKMISERGGPIAKIASSLGGVAWTLATYLTVPVLVTKNIGPIDAIKESGHIFKRTWGENVAGNIGLSWAMSLVFIGWFAVTAGVAWLVSMFSVGAVWAVMGIGFVGVLFLMLLGQALGGIYTAALYRFAMTGDAGQFDSAIVGNAFRPK